MVGLGWLSLVGWVELGGLRWVDCVWLDGLDGLGLVGWVGWVELGELGNVGWVGLGGLSLVG